MTLPHSDSRDVGPTAVLIPLRSLREGKLRLSDDYDAQQRAHLIATMANLVLLSAHDLDVLVVHDDSAVDRWASERGAATFRPTAPGLNRAVAEGRDHLRARGYARVIVAHADLPLADDIRRVDPGFGIALVPDRHGDGTNVLCVPTVLDFTFAYGPGSFQSHRDISRRLGVEPAIIEDPAFAWDVDHPDDLRGSGLLQQLSTETPT
jgi:2-phospho-L-lactate guanylyltransferase